MTETIESLHIGTAARELEGRSPAEILRWASQRHGAKLWERDPDRCCELRKIVPLRNALVGFDAWITAIRRDQTAERAHARVVEHDRKFNLVKINPLVAWSRLYGTSCA